MLNENVIKNNSVSEIAIYKSQSWQKELGVSHFKVEAQHYNKYGKLLKILKYDQSGNIISTSVYTYGSNNLDQYILTFDKDGSYTESITKYSQGRIIDSSFSTSSGEASGYSNFYDESGKIIKNVVRVYGLPNITTYYKYDENGNCIEEKSYRKGKLFNKTIIRKHIHYDKFNISDTVIRVKGSRFFIDSGVYEITNKNIREIFFLPSKNQYEGRIKEIYNDSKDLIESFEWDKNERLLHYEKRIIDKLGKPYKYIRRDYLLKREEHVFFSYRYFNEPPRSEPCGCDTNSSKYYAGI